MKLRGTIPSAVVILFCVAAPNAGAALNYLHGNQCRPESGQPLAIGYSKYGVYNGTLSSQQVWCPLTTVTPGDFGGAQVTVYDRHPGQAVVARICDVDASGGAEGCQMASTGTTQWSAQAIPLVITGQQGNDGFAYFRIELPASHANGVSHVTTLGYDD